MIASIWRYSHLSLAISSFIFILIASLTGIILAFEPVSEQLHPYEFTKANEQSLAKTIHILKNKYEEVLSLERDHNNFIIASVVTSDGLSDRFYIDPSTGKKVGAIIEKAPIYKFATNLHRSLFLKTTGRVIICIISVFLFLIAFTGVLLIIKRQGGVRAFFSKVIKEDFHQYYHVVIGRFSLIPIVIITLTGIYLSLEKFSLLPDHKIAHTISKDTSSAVKTASHDFEVFKQTRLTELKKLEFPFSDDPEDYFYLTTSNKEQIINQFNGAILSEQPTPFTALTSSFSLALHTGRGSILWSMVLLIATASILFFIYSGFAMTIQRRKKRSLLPKNMYSKDESEIVILVGSETGSTYTPAQLAYDAIKNTGKKVFISDMNSLKNYPNIKHLLIFTSTYGQGEAPSNARKFTQQLHKMEQIRKIHFSVVGFGSLAYPDFCQFATDVRDLLKTRPNFVEAVPLFKIHNQSYNDLLQWSRKWGDAIRLQIELGSYSNQEKMKKKTSFQVIKRTALNSDQTFLLQLKPNKKSRFQSGDLLKFYPDNESSARFYSIGRVNRDILLSIKKHSYGVCSNYFSGLEPNDLIYANIQHNKEFHFPKTAKEVVLIANGTGIAPFLGMIQEHHKNTKTHLFWGGRTKASFEVYQQAIDKALSEKTLDSLHIAYSKESEQSKYVQELLLEYAATIAGILSRKGIIMICGSLAMETGVREALNRIVKSRLNVDLDHFEKQVKADCY